ncbi:hypothetical protein [Bacillus cereus]|nr:hypothetical protein [Bacillus cereus]
MKQLIIENTLKTEEEFQQFQYLLRFINKKVNSCSLNNNEIIIKHNINEEDSLKTQILDILKRVSGTRSLPFKNETYYETSVETPFNNNILDELLAKNIITDNGNGLFSFRPPFSDLLLLLDQLIIDNIAKPLGALNEQYPSLISMDTLNKTNHFTSFPHHVLFTQHLKEDLSIIDSFTRKVQESDGLHKDMIQPSDVKTTSLVKNPAVCYHCYKSLENTEVQGEGYIVTSMGKCSRYESNNHSDFGRLLDFSMREIIFVGEDEFVKKMRSKSIELLKDFLSLWEIDALIENANDPFFTDDYQVKSFFQRDMEMKYEVKFKIPYLKNTISVSSSNYHGNVFGQAFSIKKGNNYVSTGCLAFGLERWIFAFLSQYGLDIKKWPSQIKKLISYTAK